MGELCPWSFSYGKKYTVECSEVLTVVIHVVDTFDKMLTFVILI
jgi:hypothetical protein